MSANRPEMSGDFATVKENKKRKKKEKKFFVCVCELCKEEIPPG